MTRKMVGKSGSFAEEMYLSCKGFSQLLIGGEFRAFSSRLILSILIRKFLKIFIVVKFSAEMTDWYFPSF